MISMRILQGFQTILLDFYKDFYKDSKGFDGISMMILVGSLSGFWRISTGQAFYKNSTRIATMVPLGFKGVLMDFYVESLRNQWESRGCLKGFCRSFYKDVIVISVRILWGSKEISSI